MGKTRNNSREIKLDSAHTDPGAKSEITTSIPRETGAGEQASSELDPAFLGSSSRSRRPEGPSGAGEAEQTSSRRLGGGWAAVGSRSVCTGTGLVCTTRQPMQEEKCRLLGYSVLQRNWAAVQIE
jgi:hypothetical protein